MKKTAAIIAAAVFSATLTSCAAYVRTATESFVTNRTAALAAEITAATNATASLGAELRGELAAATNSTAVALRGEIATATAGKVDAQTTATVYEYGPAAELAPNSFIRGAYTNGVLAAIVYDVGDGEQTAGMDAIGSGHTFYPSGRRLACSATNGIFAAEYSRGSAAEGWTKVWTATFNTTDPGTDFVKNMETGSAVAAIREATADPLAAVSEAASAEVAAASAAASAEIAAAAATKVAIANITNLMCRIYTMGDTNGNVLARLLLPLDSIEPELVTKYNPDGSVDASNAKAEIYAAADGWAWISPTAAQRRNADGTTLIVHFSSQGGLPTIAELWYSGGGFTLLQIVDGELVPRDNVAYAGYIMRETATAYTTRTTPVQMQTFSAQTAATESSIAAATNTLAAADFLRPTAGDGDNWGDKWNATNMNLTVGSGQERNTILGNVRLGTGQTDGFVFGHGDADDGGNAGSFVFTGTDYGNAYFKPHDGPRGFFVSGTNIVDLIHAEAPAPDISGKRDYSDLTYIAPAPADPEAGEGFFTVAAASATNTLAWAENRWTDGVMSIYYDGDRYMITFDGNMSPRVFEMTDHVGELVWEATGLTYTISGFAETSDALALESELTGLVAPLAELPARVTALETQASAVAARPYLVYTNGLIKVMMPE